MREKNQHKKSQETVPLTQQKRPINNGNFPSLTKGWKDKPGIERNGLFQHRLGHCVSKMLRKKSETFYYSTSSIYYVGNSAQDFTRQAHVVELVLLHDYEGQLWMGGWTLVYFWGKAMM